MTTLEEAKETVLQEARNNPKGTTCPCCGKYVKVYRRKLHSEMARFLIKLFKKYTRYQKYYNMRDLYPHSNKAASDGSYLVHWGLVERTDRLNAANAPAGLYRPTDKGLRFVHGNEYVPSHVHLLNNEVVGWSNRHINIFQALGNKLNYDELMAE